MRKGQSGFAHWLIPIVILLIVGAAGFFVYQKNSGSGGGSGPNYKALANCTNNQAVLNHAPSDMSHFGQIVPLGNIGVPDHTLPTDHMYINLTQDGKTAPPVVNIFAPGDIVITNIENSGEKRDGQVFSDDYALTFSACRGVDFLFGHIQTLNGSLADAIKDGKWDKPCDIGHQAAGEETHYCNKTVDIKLSSGDVMGMIGGKMLPAGFDFNTHKKGYVDPGFVSPKFYPVTDAVCGLDYFTPVVKAELYALVSRTAEPRCGVVGQDKADTAQGGWFNTNDSKQASMQWNGQLAIVHDNLDPTIGVLAVGGTISDPAKVSFKPVTSGTINREPSQVTAGSVYCYQDEGLLNNNSTVGQGKYLVELIDNHTLKVTHADGHCSSSETLSSPTTYYR